MPYPTFAPGTRVQHLGSPQYIGTVESSRELDYCNDPCHVELVVTWDAAPGVTLDRSRCGICSVVEIAHRGLAVDYA